MTREMAPTRYGAKNAKEVSTGHFIPYITQVTENIVKTVAGDYLFVIKLDGASHQAASDQALNAWHVSLYGFLMNIASPQVAVWSNTVRRVHSVYPEGQYPGGFVAELNAKYLDKMRGDVMMINELYVSIIYRSQPNRFSSIVESLFSKTSKAELIQSQLASIEMCEDLIATAMASLDRYTPRLLGCYQLPVLPTDTDAVAQAKRSAWFSQPLEFFSYLIDGFWQRCPLPRSPIRSMLATSRPLFGKGGSIVIKKPTSHDFAAILAIQEYPTPTGPGMLDGLLSVPFEYIMGQSLTFLSKPAARGRMTRQRDRMINAGEVAASQVEGIGEALDDLASNRFALGTHSMAILVKGGSEKELKDNISQMGSILSDAGIRWLREDTGAAGGFWSLLPANFSYRLRMGDISSANFAGFTGFHNFPIGRLQGTQWGEAVTMFKTDAGSPYYFSFHKVDEAEMRGIAKIDPNHKELANTIVIGQSGAGKTVLGTFLLAQLQKYRLHPKQKITGVFFDKDLGAAVAIRAMGGKYYPLKNGIATGWNPFKLDPTPQNITFVESLMRWFCMRNDQTLTPAQEKQLSDAVRSVFAAKPEIRRFRSILQFLPNTEIGGLNTRLERWCLDGPNAWLFDNESDNLNLTDYPIIGFDVTDFLENEETRTPTMMYLLHRIDSLFDGRKVPIFMDEFSKLLDDPAFESLSKNKLVTIRKQDGFLVMFLQYPEQALSSKIAQGLISQTATKIFLPNPGADHKAYVEGFKCTEAEYNVIRRLGEKSRKFLVKQGNQSIVAELNLRGFNRELAVLSGNAATSLLCERIVAEHGEDPDVWLPIFHKQVEELYAEERH